MTLLEKVKHFLYTHPVQHHKRELLDLVAFNEAEYLSRIESLEKQLKASRNQPPAFMKEPPITFEDSLEDLENRIDIDGYPWAKE